MSLKQVATLSLVFLALVSVLFATRITRAQTPVIISGKFYKFDVIAVDGQPGLTIVLPGPSINDKGVVSFVGRNAGSNVYISDTLGAYRDVNPGGTATSTIIDGNSQINNSNQIVALETVQTLSQNILRIWNGNAQNTSIIAAGANGGGGFNDFAAIFKNPSLNNNGQLVFSGQARNPTRNVLITGLRTDPSFSQTDMPPLFPMLADDGRLVVRAGSLSTSPIRLYNYNLASFTNIATTAMGFLLYLENAQGSAMMVKW